jgi:PAS domain S-box-containing protein
MNLDTTNAPSEAQAELLAQLEAILGCVADAVLVYDAAGRILRSNGAADALLPGSAAERAMPLAERLAVTGATWFREDGSPVPPEQLPALRAARFGETHRGVVLRMVRPGVDRWLDVTAAPLVVRGEHVGAVVTLSEVTERKRREAARALLAAIADDFARLSTEEEITAAIGARLSAHLGVTDCSVADFADGFATIRSAFTSRPAEALRPPARLRVSEYLGGELQEAARAGRTVVIRDTRTDRRVDATSYEALGIRAGVIVPLLVGGEWRHCFAVGTSSARDWRDDEVQLVQEVAARFFPRIERARAEQALREEERRYRSLFDNSLDAVYLTRTDGTILDANPAACRMHGMTVEEIRERGRKGLVVTDERHAAALRARAERGHVRAEFTDLRKDGTRFPVEAESVIVDGAEGTAFVIARDITERKRAEEALRESEQRFAVMFRRSPLAKSWTRLPERTLEDVSDAWVELTGIPREEAAGKTSLELGLVDAGSAELRRFHEDLAARGAAEAQLTIATRAKGPRVVFVRAETVLFRGERFLLAAMQDVTEWRRAEEALREAHRRKDEFLGMLSHELRNPLAPIRNALYILDHPATTGDQARHAKEVANRQIAHVTRLVEDLLDVTRIARGKIDLRRADVDVGAIARRTAADYGSVLRDRGLDLHVDVPAEPVVVHGDETRLAQVIGNLLSNAAKFTPAGGRVSLSLRPEGDRAVVRVADTGAGIAPEALPSIFEPFTQGAQTLARSEGGLGLGLALVKGVVALHGGDVKAVSAGPGRGTEIVVTLPRASGGRAREAAEHDAARPGRVKRRVLVVDDNRDAADTLAELLRMMGQEPAVAYDAFDGLAMAAEALPDVVLCDLGLPGMDGFELARRLRALAGHRPVRLVALSGYAQPEDVARALEAGFDAHVAKPPAPEQLADLLGGEGRR